MASLPLPSQAYGGVLVASSDANLREQIVSTLNTKRCPVLAAQGGADALGKLESSECDVLLLDQQLADLDAEELQRIIEAQYPGIAILGIDRETRNVTVPKRWTPGASDVYQALRKMTGVASDLRGPEVEGGPEVVAPVLSAERLPGMVGNSEAMRTIYRMVRLVAARSTTVLITGYSRQRADLAESDPIFNGTRMVGTGVVLQQITSLRDRVLELRIQDEMQQQGSLNAQVTALSDVDLQFSMLNANIGDSINAFFESLSDLSTDPSDSALRQSVLISAQNMAGKFRSTSDMLHQRQFNLDLQVQQAVAQVNQLTGQIADLNGRISSSGVPEEQLGTYVDQRNLLLQQLSSLLGNHVIRSDDGLTVTASNGISLVVGNRSYQLAFSIGGSGEPVITVGGQDVTALDSGGSISGLLKVRTQAIPDILSGLDSIASDLITSFNAVHKNGTDLNGNPGVDFFVAAPSGGVAAAAAFAVNIGNATQIAASDDGTPGSNGNLNELLNLRAQGLVNGDTLTEAYSKLTFLVGSQVSNAKAGVQSSDAMVQQLKDQRGAISGVSLDEEAANLVRYQRAYEAAARVLSVLSDLTAIAVNLGKP